MIKNDRLKDTIVTAILKWDKEKDVETRFVNHLHISHSENVFYLTFGELPFPIINQGEKFPKELKIIPKTRIAVTPNDMKLFCKVIKENLDNFLESYEGKKNVK